MNLPSPDKVCLGVIASPHGVKGLVRVRSYTENPADIVSLGVLTDRDGRRQFGLTLQGNGPKGSLLCRVDGVMDREAAAELRGQELFVDRADLPDTGDADSYYHADLVGLRIEAPDGNKIGTAIGVHNFGAGDMLELRLDGGGTKGTVFVPFNKASVPVVDIAGGRLVVEVPDGVLPGGEDAEPSEETGPGTAND